MKVRKPCTIIAMGDKAAAISAETRTTTRATAPPGGAIEIWARVVAGQL